jgi:hypothetical protein
VCVATSQRLVFIVPGDKLIGGMTMENRGQCSIELSEVVAAESFNPMLFSSSGLRLHRRDGRRWEIAIMNQDAKLEGHSVLVQQLKPWLDGQLAAGGFLAPPRPYGQIRSMGVQAQMGKWIARMFAVWCLLGGLLSLVQGALMPRGANFVAGAIMVFLTLSLLITGLVGSRRAARGEAVTGPRSWRATVRGSILAPLALVALVFGVGHFMGGHGGQDALDEAIVEELRVMGASDADIARVPPGMRRQMIRQLRDSPRRRNLYSPGLSRIESLERGLARGEAQSAAAPVIFGVAMCFGPLALLLLAFGLSATVRRKLGEGPVGRVMNVLTS